MTRKEREKMVYDRYPVKKKERECAREKQRMDELRGLMRKRLMADVREKREYHGWDFSNDASVG